MDEEVGEVVGRDFCQDGGEFFGAEEAHGVAEAAAVGFAEDGRAFFGAEAFEGCGLLFGREVEEGFGGDGGGH